MKYSWLVLSIGILGVACKLGTANAENLPGQPFATATPVSKQKGMVKKMTEHPDDIRLTASATAIDGKLTINYEITNGSKAIIYVWDQMVGYPSGEQSIDDIGAYVCLEEPATLRVVRANLPLPPNIDVARKEIPFARAIAPGAEISGTVELDLPTRERSPFYPPAKEAESKIVHFSKVRLMIGLLEAKDGMVVTERKVGDKTVLAVRGAWAGPYHRLIDQTFDVEGDVIAYKSNFDRALPMH